MSKFNVNIKWGKQQFDNIELDTNESIEVFKSQIFALTGVPPERQKVMIPRFGQLKDGTPWSKYQIKNGLAIALIGTADEAIVKVPQETPIFAEDLPIEALAVDQLSGLLNLGNTCYLNSTIQALSNIPHLREAIVKYASEPGNSGSFILRKLAFLMKEIDAHRPTILHLSDFVSEFRRKFPRFAEKGPNGGYMQQDAEECYSMLLQSLQDVPLPGTNVVNDTFSGEFLVTSKCVENPEEPPEIKFEGFDKLACHIDKDTNFLHTSLKNSLVEHISKHSPSLDRTAVYEKSVKIAKLPKYLTVQFVRFFWRPDVNARTKICRPVEFPVKFDVYEFCTEELQRKITVVRNEIKAAEDALIFNKDAVPPAATEEKSESKTEGKSETPEVDATMEDVPPAIFENDTGLYELTGVISHQGRSAEGGHYVAWVKQANGEWLLCDDEKVRQSNIEEVKKLSGHGGSDWHIAYLCFYSTITKKDAMPKPQEKKQKH